VASGSIQELHGLLWVMMITSSENRGWSGDVVVSDLKVFGPPVAFIVRTAKIATIEAKESDRIGILARGDREAVNTHLQAVLAGALEARR
jgi:mRNA interferase MazF